MLNLACCATGAVLVTLYLRLNGYFTTGFAARDLLPPKGRGNVGTLNADVLVQFAGDVVDYLRGIEHRFGVTIRRIGIDAPSDPRRADIPRRQAEIALDTVT